jgi:hypothetical protein
MADTDTVDVKHVNGELRKITRAHRLKGWGVFLLGISAVITGVVVWTQLRIIDDLRLEQECRFEVSAEVATINERINVLTAEIFVAAIDNNDPRIRELGAELRETINDLEPATERRERAVAICQQ